MLARAAIRSPIAERALAIAARKPMLRQLVPKDHPRLLYVSYVDSGGSRFFELVCRNDLEGIVSKPKTSPYPFVWIKVKNPAYNAGCRTPRVV